MKIKKVRLVSFLRQNNTLYHTQIKERIIHKFNNNYITIAAMPDSNQLIVLVNCFIHVPPPQNKTIKYQFLCFIIVTTKLKKKINVKKKSN